jgi:hypothetical protein
MKQRNSAVAVSLATATVVDKFGTSASKRGLTYLFDRGTAHGFYASEPYVEGLTCPAHWTTSPNWITPFCHLGKTESCEKYPSAFTNYFDIANNRNASCIDVVDRADFMIDFKRACILVH